MTCCLGLKDLTVTCRPQILCPGDGVNTLIACGSEDCPFTAPTCNFLTTVPDPMTGMDMDFNVCGPATLGLRGPGRQRAVRSSLVGAAAIARHPRHGRRSG